MFANMASHSIEVTEAEQPIQLLAYEFVADKAGAGKYRGGVPFRRDYRFLEDGGDPAGPLRPARPPAVRPLWRQPRRGRRRTISIPRPRTAPLPVKFTMTIKRGDVFRHVLAGAGGWGDPLERDPAAVLKDVRNELLSPAKAAADYGVVVDTARWTVDAAATAKRREEIRRARGWDEVPEGAMARSADARPAAVRAAE